MMCAQELMKCSKAVKLAFKDLPECAKSSIKRYYTHEHDIKVKNTDMFWYADIPMRAITNTLVKYNEDIRSEGTFENYHKTYGTRDVVKHRKVWTVILYSGEDSENEIILDGWHRFHWYYERGLDTVPAVMWG